MLYLIHFAKLLHHARHYLGFCRTGGLQARVDRHKSGAGAKLLAAAVRAGIEFEVVRTWPRGDRTEERRLKKRKNGPKLCPVCAKGGA